MNLLGGALYGPWLGTCLVSVLTALGSTGCYWISWKVGRPVVERWFKERVLAFKRQLNSHESDLFWYLVFSRAFPFTPNWFLNMASPHVGIRVSWFFTSILMGLLPYNFVCAFLWFAWMFKLIMPLSVCLDYHQCGRCIE